MTIITSLNFIKFISTLMTIVTSLKYYTFTVILITMIKNMWVICLRLRFSVDIHRYFPSGMPRDILYNSLNFLFPPPLLFFSWWDNEMCFAHPAAMQVSCKSESQEWAQRSARRALGKWSVLPLRIRSLWASIISNKKKLKVNWLICLVWCLYWLSHVNVNSHTLDLKHSMSAASY